MQEMKLILATLLWHFDIELADESKDWMDRVRAIGFLMKPKLMVKLKYKEGSREEFRKFDLSTAVPSGELEVQNL